MIFSQSSHCALVFLTELALQCEARGCSIEEVSERHHIPEQLLTPVAEHLCCAGILNSRSVNDVDVCYYYAVSPEKVSVLDILMHFDGDTFNGRFLNEQSGRWLPKSRVEHIINLERKHVMRYLRNRFGKMSVQRWSEMIPVADSYHFNMMA